MAMPWIRVDSNLAGNHKVLALLEEKSGDHAVCVYIFGLGYAMNADTAGFIPRSAIGLFHGRQRDADLLVKVRLWIELPGGWQVNDWAEYQPSSAEAQARSERAKRAAAARWGKREHPAADAPSNAPSIPRAVPRAMPRTDGRDVRTYGTGNGGASA